VRCQKDFSKFALEVVIDVIVAVAAVEERCQLITFSHE